MEGRWTTLGGQGAAEAAGAPGATGLDAAANSAVVRQLRRPFARPDLMRAVLSDRGRQRGVEASESREKSVTCSGRSLSTVTGGGITFGAAASTTGTAGSG